MKKTLRLTRVGYEVERRPRTISLGAAGCTLFVTGIGAAVMQEWAHLLAVPATGLLAYLSAWAWTRNMVNVPLGSEQSLEYIREDMNNLEKTYSVLLLHEDSTPLAAPKDSMHRARETYNELVRALNEVYENEKKGLLSSEKVTDASRRLTRAAAGALKLLQEDFDALLEEQRRLRLLSLEAVENGVSPRAEAYQESVTKLLKMRSEVNSALRNTQDARRDLEDVIRLRKEAHQELQVEAQYFA